MCNKFSLILKIELWNFYFKKVKKPKRHIRLVSIYIVLKMLILTVLVLSSQIKKKTLFFVSKLSKKSKEHI